MNNILTVKAASDVFALPPPPVLIALSLGYRSALADVLFTSTKISHGIHHEEHRRFEFVGEYLESVAALDPQFCDAYRYVDTFITYQPVGSPTAADARQVRRLLEKGLEACPTDSRLWLSAGQSLAFIGVQFLTDDAEKEAFRLAGAKMMTRAGELSDDPNVRWQTLSAASILSREGNREASIAYLERVYTLTDDLELKDNVAAKLRALQKEQTYEHVVERYNRHEGAFKQIWRADLPFVSPQTLLVVGPPHDPAACAGKEPEDRDCANSWTDRRLGDRPP